MRPLETMDHNGDCQLHRFTDLKEFNKEVIWRGIVWTGCSGGGIDLAHVPVMRPFGARSEKYAGATTVEVHLLGSKFNQMISTRSVNLYVLQPRSRNTQNQNRVSPQMRRKPQELFS